MAGKKNFSLSNLSSFSLIRLSLLFSSCPFANWVSNYQDDICKRLMIPGCQVDKQRGLTQMPNKCFK